MRSGQGSLFCANVAGSAMSSVKPLQPNSLVQAQADALQMHQCHADISTHRVQRMPVAWAALEAAQSTSLTGMPGIATQCAGPRGNHRGCNSLDDLVFDAVPTTCRRDVKRAHRERAAILQTADDPLHVSHTAPSLDDVVIMTRVWIISATPYHLLCCHDEWLAS